MAFELNAKIICDLFKQKKPFLIGRIGSTELEILLYYYNTKRIRNNLYDKLERYSGVMGVVNNDWENAYLDAISNCDVMAEGWYEPLKEYENIMVNEINTSRYTVKLRNLEPYYVDPTYRWSQYLAGKRVAIINSFADLCETQTYMSKAIWGSDNAETLLPHTTTWVPIQTYFPSSIAQGHMEWPSNVKTWEDAVNYTVKRVLNEGCDTAIIGCGGLGMIIGDKLKKEGLQCIVMGGAIQILFGIRGKRWEKHNIISKFFNDSWVLPSSSHRPNNYKLIENACYW